MLLKQKKIFKYNLAVKKTFGWCRPPSEAALEVNSLISKVSMDCDMVFGDDYFGERKR